MNGQLKAKPEIQTDIRTWCPGLERSQHKGDNQRCSQTVFFNNEIRWQ